MSDTSKKNHLTTSQLLSIIKKSGQFSEVSDAFQKVEKVPLFCHYLYEVMEKHQMTAKDIISKSSIERSYFYHILSGQKTPGRNMILRICLCMNATLCETNQLLRISNQGILYPKVHRDAAIIFAIEKKYSMQQANELLLELNEIPLYREDST